MSESSLRLRAGVVKQVMHGEMVLLDTVSGRYFDLNPSGTLMLERLLAGDPADVVVAAVCGRFDAPPERVRSDLQALLAALRAAQLVDTQVQPPA